MIDVPVSTVFELALKSTLFPAVAFLLVLGLARRPAAERHVVWSAVIVGLLAVPFLQGLLPGFKVLPRLDAFAAPARTVSLPDASSPSPAPIDVGPAQPAEPRRQAPAVATPSASDSSAEALAR